MIERKASKGDSCSGQKSGVLNKTGFRYEDMVHVVVSVRANWELLTQLNFY